MFNLSVMALQYLNKYYKKGHQWLQNMIKFVFSYQNIVRRDSLYHVFLIKSLSQYFLYALFENINII